jgi:predicted phosphoribosyltransferase
VIARVRELLRARQPIEPTAQQAILIIDDSLTFRAELGAALESAQ